MRGHRVIGVVLLALVLAQLSHAQSDFRAIDSAGALIEEYASPTVIGLGIFIVAGSAAGVMAFFGLGGWRIAVLVSAALYVWAVWYPDFLRLVFKYGAWNVISGIFEQARSAGTLASVVLHKVLYPLGFFAVAVATLWDFRSGRD